MKKQIRQGVFETNSSSTHSICIAKNMELTIPSELHFSSGQFGWDCDTLKSIDEKASYLFTGFHYNERKEDFEKIVEVLKNKGIEVTFDSEMDGYIDHADQLGSFLNDVCSDEGKLMRFLFSPLSFIITGNDNDDMDVDINVSYEHDSYYKGN